MPSVPTSSFAGVPEKVPVVASNVSQSGKSVLSDNVAV
jgi:hypothetical protein